MIKNFLIVILTLAVITLVWMGYFGQGKRQEMISDIQSKLKEQIEKAYEAAHHEVDCEVEDAPVQEVTDEKSKSGESVISIIVKEDNPGDNISEMSADATNPVNTSKPEQTAGEILKSAKKNPLEKDKWLTSEELKSVLSILKSAQNILRKTSFTPEDPPSNVQRKKDNPQTEIIKKKSSNGLAELG